MDSGHPTRVVVVGGGLAGLFTALHLVGEGVEDVVVVDGGATPGGVTRTIQRDGYLLEPAAGSLLLPHPDLSAALDRIGAAVVPATAAGLRYVYTRGRMVPIPASPRAALAPLVPLTAKLRAAAEPFIRTPPPSPDESLDSLLRRRLGDRLGELLAWVAASGVFAGDPTRLSARAAFPALPALEDAAGSLVRGGVQRLRQRPSGAVRPTSHLPVGGMSGLADTAGAALGDRLRLDFPVRSVRPDGSHWLIEGEETLRADRVVLAVRPVVAAGLLGGDLGAVLERAVSAPVVVVGLGGPHSRVPVPSGFGVLTGPDADMVSLGILFESSYAPDRAPAGHGLIKVIAGGARRPDLVEWDDARIIELVIDEVSKVLGSAVEPSFVELVKHPVGVPQYEVGHARWLDEIDAQLAALPGLYLTGWGYRGVGVGHVAADASACARDIAAEVRP